MSLPRPTDIRAAREQDIAAVVALGRTFHGESRYAHIPYVADHFARYLARFIADPANALFLVSERDGQVTGFFIATLQPLVFSPGLTANQQLMYIDESARDGFGARAFVRRYVAWARERQAIFADFPETAGIVGQRLGILATRFGFEQVGTIYRHMGTKQGD